MVQQDVVDETPAAVTPIVYATEAREHESYAVSGWFKWVTPVSR